MEELGGALLMLRAKYDTLILSERRVADYVLENPLEVSQCTATQLAKAVQVSKTTVIRLCQTLGYQGYHDFKYALIHDVAKRDTDIFDDIFPADSPYEILKKVSESNCMAIMDTLKLLDPQQLAQAAQQIMHARKTALYATGGSSVLAMDLQQKLLRLGYECSFIQDGRYQEMQSLLTREGEVAIGISFSGRSRHVLDCLHNSKAHGAVTVGLTNTMDSPLAKSCDILLLASSTVKSKVTSAMVPRISQMNVIDALFMLLVQYDKAGSEQSLEETWQIIDRERVKK